MARYCSQCGKRTDSFFGISEHRPVDIDMLQAAGEDVQSPLCVNCVDKYRDKLNSLYAEREKTKRDKEKARQEDIQVRINNMPVCTISPYSLDEYEIMGIASAYVAMGTGPLTALASSISDFFGQQSESYNLKMIEAETACLQKLKTRTSEMGANAVVGLNTTYTELTQGHGMLLVCMNGTAIKRKLPAAS